MDLKGGACVRVAGFRKGKESLVSKGSPTRFEVGALLRDDMSKIVGGRNKGKATMQGLVKGRRVKSSSHPGNSLRDNHL
jgi:hypothetical protein